MSDLYTRFVANVLFPLKKHDTVQVHGKIEVLQWWLSECILRLQAQCLRTLLEHAGTHVPHYRDLFARTSFDPAKVDSVADLQSLPFLTKADIRASSDALRADNAVGLAHFNTEGSSGELSIFFIGAKRVSHDVAAKWHATH